MTKDGDRSVCRKDGFGHRIMPEKSGFHLRQSRLNESACNSLTCLSDTTTNKKVVFKETHFKSAWAKGSYGTVLIKICIILGELIVDPSTFTGMAETAATYGFTIDGDLPSSRS